jgi:hypothetical protein
MNAAHLHLIINHLPIFATWLAVPVAIYGVIATGTPHVLRINAFLLLCAGLATVVAMESGEDAEDMVEALPNVNSLDIHAHSEMAHAAAKVALATSAVSLMAVVVDGFSRGRRRRRWTFVLLVSAIASGVMMTRTGLSGGQINHPEIKEGYEPSAPVAPDAPLDL